MVDKPYGDCWDRYDLIKKVKSFCQKLHGNIQEVGMYDDLEI